MADTVISRILYDTGAGTDLASSGTTTLFKGVNGNYFVFIDDDRIPTEAQKFRAYSGEQALEFMKKHATIVVTDAEFGVADA